MVREIWGCQIDKMYYNIASRYTANLTTLTSYAYKAQAIVLEFQLDGKVNKL